MTYTTCHFVQIRYKSLGYNTSSNRLSVSSGLSAMFWLIENVDATVGMSMTECVLCRLSARSQQSHLALRVEAVPAPQIHLNCFAAAHARLLSRHQNAFQIKRKRRRAGVCAIVVPGAMCLSDPNVIDVELFQQPSVKCIVGVLAWLCVRIKLDNKWQL